MKGIQRQSVIEYDNFQKSLERLEEQYENYRERDDSLPN